MNLNSLDVKRKLQVLDADYRIEEDSPVIRLFCRNSSGGIKVVVDREFRPYFYVISGDLKKVEEEILETDFEKDDEELKVIDTEVVRRKNPIEEEEVLKVYGEVPPEIPKLRAEISKLETVDECREFDIPFYKRYIIDKQIPPADWIELELEEDEDYDYSLESIEDLEAEGEQHDFDTLAFDLEVFDDAVEMASFYSEDFELLLTTAEIDRDYVETVEDEEQLILRFKEIIDERDPDVITGYNTDEFDFQVLRERARSYGMELDIGILGEKVKFDRRGRFSSARVKGRMHLDLYPFIAHVLSPGLDSETLDLDSVAEEMLGRNKDDLSFEKMKESWEGRKDLEELADYGLKDSELAYELSEEIIPQVFELSRITGLIPFDACRLTYGQLTENFLLREAYKRNKVSPNRPFRDEREKRRRQGAYTGGFVYSPEPGLYEDIALLDFKSLYPTVMVSHNISPETLDLEGCDDDFEVEKFGYNFCQDFEGFFPELIEDLITERTEIKQKLGEARDKEEKSLDSRQRALKILANSFYGYLGYDGARWYSKEAAEATTYLGRQYIQDAVEKAEDNGFEVVYGDSLDYTRQIVLKDSEGKIEFREIGDFVENTEKHSEYQTLAFDSKNEKTVFGQVKSAISHEYDEELLKISTNRGRTVTTPQHSVYKFEQGQIELADASELQEGDKLVSLSDLPDEENLYSKYEELDVCELKFDSDYLRAYTDKKKFPAENGVCPYCGEERYLSSHVHQAHSDRKVALDEVKEKHEYIGGKNAKTGKIPRFWELDEEFAWILGFYCGDGSASTGQRMMVSFGGQNRDNIEKVRDYFNEKLETDLQIIEDIDSRTGNKMYYYRVQRKPLVSLFVEGLGMQKGSEHKRAPEIILNGGKTLKNAFIKGYTEADGSIEKESDSRYNANSIRFSSKSSFLSNQVQYLIKQLDFGQNRYGRRLNDVSYKYRSDKPKIKSIRTTAALKPEYHEPEFTPAKINDIEKIEPYKQKVYDLEVEGCHNFVDAEGLILVHNTDSVFLRKDDLKHEIDDFLEIVNSELPSFMELELEGYFKRGFFTSKDSGKGAKKKYALLSEDGSMKITGFEYVRRDWSPVAKKTQKKVLRKVLEDKPSEGAEIVKETIQELKDREIPVEDLRIYTKLTKKPENYDSTAPHVEAAKKAMKRGDDISPEDNIAYVITRGGGSISDRAELVKYAEDYDADYYIDKQIIPVSIRVLKVFGYTSEELKGKGRQSGLGKFG